MKEINPTFNRYKKSIVLIEKSDLNNITNLKQGITLSRECLNKFSNLVRSQKFPSKKEEITFFKYQKPYVEGRLQYFKELHNYLLEKPVSGISKQQKFITSELNKLDNKRCKQMEFVKYYRLKEKRLDHLYFLRYVEQLDLFVDRSHHFKDPDFTTSHDYLVSKIIANELLIQFYTNELETLKKNNDKTSTQEVQNSQNNLIPWTGTTTELIELLYGANAEGAMGNGNLSLKEIEDICIKHYGIIPGNIYNIVEQIKARKNNHTKFIDKLKLSLLNEIID